MQPDPTNTQPGRESVTITLPHDEWMLISAMLKLAHDDFHEHGCNDLDEELVELLPDKRWQQIAEHHLSDGTVDGGKAMQRDDFVMDYYGELISDLADGRAGGMT